VKEEERNATNTGSVGKTRGLRSFTRKRRGFRMTNGWMGCDYISGGAPPHSKPGVEERKAQAYAEYTEDAEFAEKSG
jgi:hypothetical protein